MPSGKAATLRGIFGHMLNRVLKVAKKSGRTLDPDMVIKGRGTNVVNADHIVVFKVGKTKNLRNKANEYVRQLRGQMKGINNMTADDLIQHLENVVREGKEQKKARRDFNEYLKDISREKYRQQGMRGEGLGKKIKNRVGARMSRLAALHNPDIVAGGEDIIRYGPDGLPHMGDTWVNSSIGSQWAKGRAMELLRYARRLQAAGRGGELLNVDFILE